jgi:predicted nucleic acid-binding protein
MAPAIPAALEPGCHTLYSQDLNHGQTCAGVRAIDPFAG